MAKVEKTIGTEDEISLPPITDGEIGEVLSVSVQEKKTKPPALYTEGTLLDDMKGAAKFVENDPALKKALKVVSGLGTAATRDSIIEALKDNEYLEKSGKHLVATPKGEAFVLWLEQIMPEITDVAVTARWEAELAIVAEHGGGSAFEAKVSAQVRKLITTLQHAPLLTYQNSKSETKTMSDEAPRRTSTPTDKMLEFAKSIAKKVGVRVPDEVMTDFDACKAFIDANKDTAMRPTEKQVSFAESIAKRKGVSVPPEVMANSKELSKWIDDNK